MRLFITMLYNMVSFSNLKKKKKKKTVHFQRTLDFMFFA